MRRKKIEYPATNALLKRLGYEPTNIMIRGFGPFTHLEKPYPLTRRRNSLVMTLIVYPVFLWEKKFNLHHC